MARVKSTKHRRYTVHTALAAYVCMVCGGDIVAGEKYTRRRYRSTRGEYMTLRKCGRCVPVRGGER